MPINPNPPQVPVPHYGPAIPPVTSITGDVNSDIFDSAGNSLDSTAGALDVNVTGGGNASVGPTGATVPADATYVAFDSGGNLSGISVSSPLPTALPSATVVTLTPPTAASIGTAVSGDLLIGTQVAGSSVPVALPSATISTLTPLSTVTSKIEDSSGNSLTSTGGSLNVNLTGGGGPFSVNQGNQGTAAESWFVEVTDGTNVLGTSSHPLRIDPTGSTTQPISAASLPLPSNASQESGGNLAAIVTALTNPLPVSLPAGTVTILTPPSAIAIQQGAPNIAATQVSVGSIATSIISSRTTRTGVLITNTTSIPIYIGGSGVTTSSGSLLPGIIGAFISINTNAQIYGIVATGSATVTTLEVYN